MSQSSLDDIGKLILRLTLGILLLFHGVAKLAKGSAGIEAMVVAKGLPAFVAWGVYLGEVVGPILLIIGLYTRLGAVLALVNMLFALGLAHMGHFFELSQSGGWRLELQAFFLFTSVAVLFLGAGRLSLGGPNGRWN